MVKVGILYAGSPNDFSPNNFFPNNFSPNMGPNFVRTLLKDQMGPKVGPIWA
jgi:hypothetical protein